MDPCIRVSSTIPRTWVLTLIDASLGTRDPNLSAKDLGMAYVDLSPSIGDSSSSADDPYKAFVDLGPSAGDLACGPRFHAKPL